MGVGVLQTNPVLTKENMEIAPELSDEVMQSNAVGDIALCFFDVCGNKVDSRLRDLVIGISPEEMKQVDTVVGIAGGPDKTEVIRGALRGKWINVLITDNHTAQNLMNN